MKKLFNRATKILLSTDLIVLISTAMLGPFYTVFVENIGGSFFDVSLTIAIFAFVSGVTTLVSGRFIKKVKEEELLVVIGYGLLGLSFILYIFVNSIWSLFAIQVLAGFASAIYSPALNKLHDKHVKKSKIGKIKGTWEAMDYFSVSIGAIVGGILVYYGGFEMLFIVMASFCLLSAIYIYFLPRETL